MPTTRLATGTLAGLLALALAGCSGSEGDPTPAASTAGGASASADAADAATTAQLLYLQRMAQFERQAQSLARTATTRASSPEVAALASDVQIRSTQLLARLDQALVRLGSAVPVRGSSEGLGWGGILTDAQQRALVGARGAELDALWLTALIETDREAVTLSTSMLPTADDAEVTGITTDVIRELTAEYSTASRLRGPTRAPLP